MQGVAQQGSEHRNGARISKRETSLAGAELASSNKGRERRNGPQGRDKLEQKFSNSAVHQKLAGLRPLPLPGF